MKIEYNQAKNQANIEERGLSFDDVVLLDWDTALIAQDMRSHDEQRFIALASLGGRLHVACYTWRGEVRRVISFRKANKREVAIYEKAINE
ncbi:hypothetical protein IMCC1989_1782 [gamma proteobacterium IMCC1989]|nr:hypothetical protein IMCC1989_1782 [gamma proteobacterium IMCC1989]